MQCRSYLNKLLSSLANLSYTHTVPRTVRRTNHLSQLSKVPWFSNSILHRPQQHSASIRETPSEAGAFTDRKPSMASFCSSLQLWLQVQPPDIHLN